MITTIQLDEKVKMNLDRLKESKRDTYEDVILNLIKFQGEQKRKQDKLMIEGCKEMAQDMKRIVKEWEVVDSDLDWEWNEN